MVLWLLVYTSQVTGRTSVAMRPGACPSRTGRASGIYCTGRPLQQRLLPDTHPSTGLPAQWPDSSPLCCAAALTGCTPSRYLLGASCPGCIRRQLPVCRMHRAPVARCNLSYVDWVHSQSYIACQAQVARLRMQQWYATTRNIPRLGALPGLRRRRKHS